jgi:magnesium transporter
LVVPVIDQSQRLKGIITIDDIIDVIEEEATEDIFKFAGSSDLEDFEDDDSSLKRIVYAVRSRLPWLIVTIFGGLLSASVISKFSGTLSMDTTLVLFMPLLAGMGGNVGTQSSTITVRSIALNYVEGWTVVKTILQEMAVGLIIGTVCSLIVGVIAYLTRGEMILSVIVGLSMFANIVTAATIGTLLPLTFKKIGIDPAVASALFISTVVDITGLSIYFGLATYLMRVLIN